MLLRLAWALALTTTTTATAVAAQQGSSLRFLEDAGDKDFSGSYAKYSNCFRVKIQNNNDDDAEGNSYFYNGKYYAQYETYAAFHLCSANECGKDSCDASTGYVTDLNTYLESNVEFVQEYCNACSNQCRRRLEDAAEEEEMYVECDTCSDQCALFQGNDDGYDEANYLDCQAGYNDGETQYYQGPTCDSSGNIVIGMFYDEDCTVKSNAALDNHMEFKYETFGTIESMCAPCDDNEEVCGDLYDGATHCAGSSASNGNGDNTICKKYYDAVREVTYARRKRKRNFVPIFVTLLILSCTFCFLSHTYFIRHRNKANEKNMPLSQSDYQGSPNTQTKLPPVS